jgi:hypothetical protein
MSDIAQEKFGMSVEEIDAIVERRVEEGWTWHDLPIFRTGQPEKKSLTPPWGDKRASWCAEWIEYKPGHIIPHWTARED